MEKETLKIAINRSHKGKHPTGIDQATLNAWWGAFNGWFKNELVTVDQLLEAIQDGYSYTTWHRGYRKAENFICGQHVGLDFDDLAPSETTLIDLLSDQVIQDHAGLLHTTPSHTPEKPRARVIFFLDRPIYNREKYTLLVRSIVDYFDVADQKCKDPCRFFFGAVNCDVRLLHNILTLEDAAELFVKPYLAKQPIVSNRLHVHGRKFVNRPASNGNRPAENYLRQHADDLLRRVKSAPDGAKYYTLRDVSRVFGGYVAGGYYDESEARSWLQEAIRANGATVRSLVAAEKTIDEGLTYGRLAPLYFDVTPAKKDIQKETRVVITPDTGWRSAVLAAVGD